MAAAAASAARRGSGVDLGAVQGQYNADFEAVMSSDRGLELLTAFMESQYCEENIQFHKAVKAFRRAAGGDKDEARRIFDEFVAPGAESQVTVPCRLIDELDHALDAGAADTTLFDEADRVVVFHIKHDIFPRFRESEACAGFWAERGGHPAVSATHDGGVDEVEGAEDEPDDAEDVGSSEIADVAEEEEEDGDAAPPAEPAPAVKVVLKGDLHRRGDTFHSWKRRHFVLQTGALYYYFTENDTSAIRCVSVAGVTVEVVPDDKYGRAFCFDVLLPNGSRLIALSATDAKERHRWMQAFRQQLADVKKIHAADRALPQEHRLTLAVVGHDRPRGKRYTTYNVRASSAELTWHVHRRYGEFAALHKRLSERFPQEFALYSVQGMPRKGPTTRKIVERRRDAFDRYLRKLSHIPDVANSPEFLSFVGMLGGTATGAAPPASVVPSRAVEVLDAGDLVLFRTRTALASVTRRLTRSEWDHVAMVVRVPMRSELPSSLCLFEAIGDGVVISPLAARMDEAARERFSVSFRKLHWEVEGTSGAAGSGAEEAAARRAAALDRLDAFTGTAVGKGYSLRGLLRGGDEPPAAAAAEADGGGGGDDARSSYFCSELVAHALQAMGLLPESINVSGWMPGHFASGSEKPLPRYASEVAFSFGRSALEGAALAGEEKRDGGDAVRTRIRDSMADRRLRAGSLMPNGGAGAGGAAADGAQPGLSLADALVSEDYFAPGTGAGGAASEPAPPAARPPAPRNKLEAMLGAEVADARP